MTSRISTPTNGFNSQEASTFLRAAHQAQVSKGEVYKSPGPVSSAWGNNGWATPKNGLMSDGKTDLVSALFSSYDTLVKVNGGGGGVSKVNVSTPVVVTPAVVKSGKK